MKLHFPRFLSGTTTEETVIHVVEHMFDKASPWFPHLRCNRFFVVVSGPMQSEDANGERNNFPGVLGEVAFDNHDGAFKWRKSIQWEKGSVRDIARSKNTQLREGRHDGRPTEMAHLLLPGDTRYWGGWVGDGLFITASGEEPAVDRAASQMIGSSLMAQAALRLKAAKEGGSLESFI